MPPGCLLLWVQSGGLWWWLGPGLSGAIPLFLAVASHQVYSVSYKVFPSSYLPTCRGSLGPEREEGNYSLPPKMLPVIHDLLPRFSWQCSVVSGACPVYRLPTMAALSPTGEAVLPVKENTEAWLKRTQNTLAEENKAISVVSPPTDRF